MSARRIGRMNGRGVCFRSSHRLVARAALHAPAAVRRAPASALTLVSIAIVADQRMSGYRGGRGERDAGARQRRLRRRGGRSKRGW